MPRILIEISVRAPRDVVFDLSRSIDLHRESQRNHREKAVAGRTSGLIHLGEEVTWEAVHFGVKQRLTSRITALHRPEHFRDSMVDGAFARFDHDHFFLPHLPGETLMREVFDFTSPLSFLGILADRLFLTRYMRQLLEDRGRIIKRVAESGDYQRFIPVPSTDSGTSNLHM